MDPGAIMKSSYQWKNKSKAKLYKKQILKLSKVILVDFRSISFGLCKIFCSDPDSKINADPDPKIWEKVVI